MQKQVRCVDCGVYAIAGATSLLYGANPSEQYRHPIRVRAVFLSCTRMGPPYMCETTRLFYETLKLILHLCGSKNDGLL